MSVAMAARPWVFGFGVLLSACGPKTAASHGAAAPSPASRPPASTPTSALPPATEDERELAKRLRATVDHLAVDVGERNGAESWNLATVTDDLAVTLEKIGYEVRRQGIVVGENDAVVQNLEVHVPGAAKGMETIVVGAHFDSLPGTPGADDDASGVAAVLELARAFQDAKVERTLRFAFFTNEAAPDFQTEHMGSLVYAKDLVTQGFQVVGMLDIDGIGAFSAQPGSEREPPTLLAHYPSTADFLAIVGNEPSRAFLEQVTASMKKHTTLPVVGNVFAAGVPFASASDDWSFLKLGMPTVRITDTAPFRYPHYHQKTDLPEQLDFDRMARVVAGLRRTLEEVAQGSG